MASGDTIPQPLRYYNHRYEIICKTGDCAWHDENHGWSDAGRVMAQHRKKTGHKYFHLAVMASIEIQINDDPII